MNPQGSNDDESSVNEEAFLPNKEEEVLQEFEEALDHAEEEETSQHVPQQLLPDNDDKYYDDTLTFDESMYKANKTWLEQENKKLEELADAQDQVIKKKDKEKRELEDAQAKLLKKLKQKEKEGKLGNPQAFQRRLLSLEHRIEMDNANLLTAIKRGVSTTSATTIKESQKIRQQQVALSVKNNSHTSKVIEIESKKTNQHISKVVQSEIKQLRKEFEEREAERDARLAERDARIIEAVSARKASRDDVCEQIHRRNSSSTITTAGSSTVIPQTPTVPRTVMRTPDVRKRRTTPAPPPSRREALALEKHKDNIKCARR